MNSKFKIIIETITSTLKETPNYLVIMFIFVYIFALLGLQVFAGKLTDSSSGMGTPRMNFDNLLWALLSVV
jgi:voltage-dependent calcium channel L type alpha-1D